jgi:methyltransferase family protein
VVSISTLDGSTEFSAEFLSPASFWLPEHLVTSAWIEHAPFSFWLVNALKPSSIVELGVYYGYSYLTFCQAVRDLNLSSRCFGIDTWRGDEQTGTYGEDVYEQLCRDNGRYAAFSRLIHSTFDDAYDQFADGSIDLLHIDGCHFYEAVRHDFEKWRIKLSDRAVVLFHDTNEPDFGVFKLWAELRTRYRHFEFLHGHGLGALGFGKNLPIKIEELFSASRNELPTQFIRAAYARLGGAISDRQTAKRLENAVGAYQASTSWRLTAPIRAVGRLVQSMREQK